LTVVRVILTVAGGAIHGRAFEDSIFMATLTGNSGMFPVKMERELRVIYICWFPSCGQVTCSALRTELTFVVIILCMTGETFLRSGFQIGETARAFMARRAFRKDVFSVQIERNFVMVKV
jgi:hypothetical protein